MHKCCCTPLLTLILLFLQLFRAQSRQMLHLSSIRSSHVWSDCVSAQYHWAKQGRLIHIALVYIALAQINCRLCSERAVRLFAHLLWNRLSVHKAIMGDYTQRACWVFLCEMFALAQYGAIITLTTCFYMWFLISHISQIYRTHKE